MTAFVESCVETVAGSASAAERRAKGRPRAAKLLKSLGGKQNILITTHLHPDPDALASIIAMATLLRAKLDHAKVSLSIKGRFGGGVNEVFARHANPQLLPWDDAALASYDAIILLDTQPQFAFSPLPPGIVPSAIIDHHRGPKARPNCAFCDVRTEVGSTSSIIFSYFMELDVGIRPDLGAVLLFAIETDLAGAAATPGELDNIALSSLTLIADPRKIYQMRYSPLTQSYYAAYAQGLANAIYVDKVLMSHLDTIDSLEKPAVLADFLLRFEQVQWAMVTGVHENKLVMSLRTNRAKPAASDLARRIFRGLGDAGGHRTKAGGFLTLQTGAVTEIDKIRKTMWTRYLRALGIHATKAQRLVPK